MLFGETAVFSEIHTKHAYDLCVENVDFLCGKPGAT